MGRPLAYSIRCLRLLIGRRCFSKTDCHSNIRSLAAVVCCQTCNQGVLWRCCETASNLAALLQTGRCEAGAARMCGWGPGWCGVSGRNLLSMDLYAIRPSVPLLPLDGSTSSAVRFEPEMACTGTVAQHLIGPCAFHNRCESQIHRSQSCNASLGRVSAVALECPPRCELTREWTCCEHMALL